MTKNFFVKVCNEIGFETHKAQKNILKAWKIIDGK